MAEKSERKTEEKTLKTPEAIGAFGLGISNLGAVGKTRETFKNVRVNLRYDGKCIDKTLIPPEWEAALFGGENARKGISEDLLFLSPSVRRDAPCFEEAKARGVTLSSDAEFFFEGLPDYGIKPYAGTKFAVTGSDGKSTVTALAAAMLGERGIPCGNFGRSFSSLPPDAFPVAELSSFQLLPFVPKTDRAVVTNVTENHLNWHRDFAEYREAKEHLFIGAKERVLSAEAAGVSFLAEKYPLFCLVSPTDGAQPDPSRAEHLLTVRGGVILLDGEPFADLSGAKNKSAHMVENILFAIALTLGYADERRVREVIGTFEGLPHRDRKIAEDGGTSWYDSSIDSTPARTACTLKERTSPAVVIVGGRGKNLAYEPLADALCACAKAAVLLGENAREIAALLEERGFPCTVAADMEDAVRRADALAGGQYDVILSPASTSFDRYRDYTERGRDYEKKVNDYLQQKHKIQRKSEK